MPLLARRYRRSGFTAIEVIVTVAVVGILAAVAAPSMIRALNRIRIRSISRTLRQQIQTAQIKALKNKDVRHGVAFNLRTSPHSSRIFLDNNRNGRYDPGSDGTVLEATQLPVGVRFFIPAAPLGILDSVVLFRGNRSAQKAGKIGLTNTYRDTVILDILASTGRVKIM